MRMLVVDHRQADGWIMFIRPVALPTVPCRL